MLGDVREAAHLLVLGEQVEQRVEDQVDERVAALDRNVREVADRDGEGVPARLRPEPVHHRR
jgi:hypothetical protein